jgi:predicted acyltransferase
LLIIGLLIVNSSSLNPELTGMPRLWWIGLVYICIFLVWNNYPQDKYKKLFLILKTIGVIGLIYLSAIFRAGSVDTPIWFERSWWGILGLIGWGYFAGSSVYLLIKERIWRSFLAVLLFLFLNIASMNGWIPNLFPGQDWFNVLLQGNVPMIVMSGITATLIVRKFSGDWKKLAIYLTLFGLISLVLGLILHQWFIVSKILATPSWGMLCNGISILLFVLIYYLIDVRGNSKYSKLFELAGQNSLTTYLAPDLIYFMIWGSGLSILFYKQDYSMWLAVIGSLIWAYAMLWFGLFLNRIGIKLKL